MDISKLSHPIYTNFSAEKGEAQGWAFLDKATFQHIYFSLPVLSDDEVRGRILYAGLCHSDSLTGREKWGPAKFPLITGHEIVAEATHVGKHVTHLKAGDKFLVGCFRDNCHHCHQCKETRDNLCTGVPLGKRVTYGEYFGGYASHIQIKGGWAFKAPEGLDLADAAPLMCAGITTYAPLKKYAKHGGHALVIGVGGLGHLAVQYAKALGMKVTAFVSKKGTEDMIKALGGDETVVWTESDLKEHQNKFNVAICTLPVSPTEDQMTKLLNCMLPEGHFIQVGAPEQGDNLKISPMALIVKQISIHGSIVGSHKETIEMLEFTAKHKVKVMCEHFKFEDFPKALEKLEKGKPHFRCVVDIDPVSKAMHN